MLAQLLLFVGLASLSVSLEHLGLQGIGGHGGGLGALAHLGSLGHDKKLHIPQPYAFGYNVKDKKSDQHREEKGDGKGGVKGSYGYKDAKGIYRQVDYIADKLGFRAIIKTNEPGTSNQNSAHALYHHQHPPHHVYHDKGILGGIGHHGLGGHHGGGSSILHHLGSLG